jgi:pimeloyl-ACP methyl ester carboxylesterase
VRPAVARGRADIGTAKLYYEVRGSGRPLVLLHGGLSSSVDFEAIIPELSRSFRVITIDRRGHGRSSDSDAPFTYEGMADEVKAVLDGLSVGPAAFIGFSDGGVVGYQLASRYPELVTRLVAVGANSRVDGMTAETLQWARSGLTVEGLARDVPDAEKRFRALNPRPNDFPRFIEKSRELWLRDPYVAPDALARIVAPVLFVLGERDAIRLEHVLEMRSHVKQGHLCVLPATTHFLLSEKPSLILPILLDFLQAGPAGQR